MLGRGHLLILQPLPMVFNLLFCLSTFFFAWAPAAGAVPVEAIAVYPSERASQISSNHTSFTLLGPNDDLEEYFCLHEGVFFPAPEITSCLRRRDQQQGTQIFFTQFFASRFIGLFQSERPLIHAFQFSPLFKEIFGYLFLLTPF